MKLKIRRKKLKAQGQAQETGPLQTQVQVQSASASLPEGERQTPKEKQRKHQPKQQRRRRRRRLWQRQRKELNEPNACIHDPIQSHVRGPRSDHSEEQNDHENEHENENEHNPLYAGNSGGKIVSIGNGHDSHIDTDVRRNIGKNVGGSDANHVGISKNELEPYEHEEEEEEQEEEQQPLMNPKKEMLIIKEFSRTDQDRPEVIIPGAGDLKNVELDLDLDSNDELNSDRSESESGSEPIAGSDLDIDLNSNLDSNLDLNDGPTLLSGSQSLSLFPPIDTIETELQRSNSSITSPLGNYGADHYHNLNRNTSRNNIKQSDHSNGNSNGSDNIHINTHHTENRRLSMNTFAFTDSIATSKINNNSKSNHNHNHEHSHDHDHDSRNNNSNCNSNSFNNSMTKQMSISQNINNIIMNNFHNTAFVYIKPHANTKKTQQLVRLTLLDSINPFSYNYTDNDDVDDNNESNDDDDDDGRTGRIISEYDITADVIQNNNLVDKHYRLIAKYATGIRGSVSCRTKIQPNKFRSIFGEDLDTVLKERRIYNALEALSACACTPQLLNELWVEAEEFRLEKDDEPKHKHLKKVVEFDRGYCCGNLLIHNKNVYVINGFYMALRQSYIEPGSSIHAYVVQWNTPSSLSSSVRSTSLPSTLGSTTLQWHQFRDKVIGSTNPREAADGSLRKMIYDQYAELGIDLELRPTALNNAIHASASPLEGLAEQISWLQQDVSSVEYGRVLLGRGVPESVILDWCHDLEVKVPNPKSVLNGETNQHENGNRNGRRITLWRRQQAPRSMSKSSFSYQSPFELVQNLDAKECSDKLIGLYDYELFGASEQQTKCCKFKCS